MTRHWSSKIVVSPDSTHWPCRICAGKCDLRITGPTILVKTDFPGHIYHHMTSVLETWASIHASGLKLGDVNIFFVDGFAGRRTVNEFVRRWVRRKGRGREQRRRRR